MLRFILILFCGLFSFHAFADNMILESQSIANGVPMPVIYTCDGKDISPDFRWSHLPSGTQSLAIILSDEDAPGGTFYHWVVYNLPADTKEIEQAMQNFPLGTQVGKNSWGKSQYNGPCPPKGALHHYIFTLYALDKKLSAPADVGAPTLLKNMQGHILGTIQLKTSYTRWLV